MGANSWRSLSESIRGDLAPTFMGTFKDYYFGSPDFAAWHKQYYSNAAGVARESVFPEWCFNHKLTSDERNSLLCVYAKLKSEDLWRWVKALKWVSKDGAILFFVAGEGPVALRQYLVGHGYGTWWLAKRGNWAWGFRSKRTGAQLHFRGQDNPNQEIEAHIDLHNPGDSNNPFKALEHSREDDDKRTETHVPKNLRTALSEGGIGVPIVP